MKVYLLLLLLLPAICSADFNIQCYGEDFLNVNNMLLDCGGKVQQACYTKDNGRERLRPAGILLEERLELLLHRPLQRMMKSPG
ncbi:hypothetical protein GBF38_002883 [Nibea albiflora]|uniref:Uncharacterized protein n=1 Tax=Nibea albiflora TaxID=240163 RepID=A0ACB7EF13_NIBAL|nr:hypothetical protein GBF38_002883 [Nibea albiflora]